MVIPDCTRIKHIKMSFNQGKINVIMQLKSLEYKSHDHDTKFICKIKLNYVNDFYYITLQEKTIEKKF